MKQAGRFLRSLPLLLVSPVLILLPALGLALADVLWLIAGRRKPPVNRAPRAESASVVIPNWNGRDLLEKYLPSVVTAMSGHPENEVIVVDNGSADGSAEFVRASFPGVKLLALPENLGFGGGSNAGFRAAKNDIVVLLNSDMRVAPDFLAPLLEGFAPSGDVFAVSCQIFFSDPQKKREETGLTQGWWSEGSLRVRHRLDDEIDGLFPCFYGGGGSCAFDRNKFLELGGFDELLKPFYLEDTDLGYLAWKRGWRVLYQPRSIVFHEHRGTIGKKFSPEYIQSILKKNFLLFTWKNIADWRKLAMHFVYAWSGAVLSLWFGDSPERANLAGLARAVGQLPGAIGSRWRARNLAMVNDDEALRRPLGGYYRDRFERDRGLKPRVLFVSPYGICPPIHGGAVFMYQTVRELAQWVDLHLIILVDSPGEIAPHDELKGLCRSIEFLVRLEGQPKQIGSIEPYSVREFRNGDLDWLIHRQLFRKQIDVLQLEYTNMGQYAGSYRRIVNAVFEHDVYFQSLARQLRRPGSRLNKLPVTLEYLRALRYETRMLERVDHAQVCSQANRDYVLSFRPELAAKLESGLRAGIETGSYEYREGNREPDTLLFLGSFRHLPNQEALFWFLRHVFWQVLRERPRTRVVIVGSDPPDRHALPHYETEDGRDPIEIVGFVEDVRAPLYQYSAFICPILTGSGVRVKLLEAFSAGIPVVSTAIGAEGLAEQDGAICRLSDSAEGFARACVESLENPDQEMTQRARREVEQNWDMRTITAKLARRYEELIEQKNSQTS
jgi:GT2 family glycosyltransferase/glycosyltransferase involved in cell wall biosynthesis